MITYAQPPQNVVYAMDKNGIGHINIKFVATGKNVKLELTDIAKNTSTQISLKSENNTTYSAQLDLPKGKYKYTITETSSEQTLVPVVPIEINFSVGRVLVIIGHSLASSNGEKWVTDNRVRIVEGYDAKTQQKWRDESLYVNQKYLTCPEIWEEKKTLPADKRVDYEIGIWGILAEKIAQRDDCDVAIVNTAMGGSSVKMWADEALSRPFNHGFGAADPNVPDQTLYNAGIPYFHFENTLKHLVAQTGVSAVLVMHGENDMDASLSAEGLAKYYDEVISTARKNAKMPNLPFILGKSVWLLNEAKGITQAIIDKTLKAVDLTIQNTPQTYVGADTHLLPMSYRQLNNAEDGHFNADGGKEVARLWSLILTEDYFKKIAEEAKQEPKVVNNPIVTANSSNDNQYQFPFMAALFVLVLTVILKLTGMKIPILFVAILTASTFGGSLLVQKLIKS